jgi:hypothetical protein
MFKAIPLALSASFVVVACAGNRPPDASTASPAAGGASGDSAAAGKDAPWNADSQRETVMQACSKKIKSPDFCQCEFEQFRDIFKDTAPVSGDPSKEPRFATLAERTKASCASKVPEDVVKSSFLSGCVEDDKRKAPYCECAWPALRKNLALTDFVLDAQGPRFDEAKKAMAKTCKGKFPVDLAKAGFMQGCMKDDASKTKSCECLWKKVHAKYSAEEIVAGAISLDQIPGLNECK